MSLSRRQMLLASLGLVVAGCGTTHSGSSARPRTEWPGGTARPQQTRTTRVDPPRSAPPSRTTAPVPARDGIDAVTRNHWASAGPVASRVNPMNGVNRITVHHEGWTNVWFDDQRSTASRIEQIRQIHVRDRGWGDIGYHYIIDRAGRVWQGRSLRHQGAHVSNNNEHNIGIMVLGNFDQQRPSDAQVNRLVATLRTLMQTHNVATHRVYTHQELSASACPGLNLQPRMVALRQGGHLA